MNFFRTIYVNFIFFQMVYFIFKLSCIKTFFTIFVIGIQILNSNTSREKRLLGHRFRPDLEIDTTSRKINLRQTISFNENLKNVFHLIKIDCLQKKFFEGKKKQILTRNRFLCLPSPFAITRSFSHQNKLKCFSKTRFLSHIYFLPLIWKRIALAKMHLQKMERLSTTWRNSFYHQE